MSPGSPPRVRFAPSPTGRLHVGGARTALFNWAFARRHGGVFVLRIEDTDQERNSAASLRSILDSLRWLGLDWDEGPEKGGDAGPYFQSQRQDRYREAARRGLEEGWLYRCFCPPARVAALKEEQRAARSSAIGYDRRCRGLDRAEAERRAAAGEAHVLRFAVPAGEEIVVRDHIRGRVRFRSEEVEDWVAVRSGGMPTYNFVCALDDAAMAISHVIRGEEHLANTPKQLLLCRALGLPEPEFAHVPLILGADGRKLSKRTGDTAIEDYRAKGYPAPAMFNFLGLLGFAIDDRTDRFTPEEFVAAFDLGRINKAGAVFDLDRLHWLCGEYLRATPPAELAPRLRPWLAEAGIVGPATSEEWLERFAAAFRERLRLYGDAAVQGAFLRPGGADRPDAKATAALAAPETGRVLAAAAERLEQAEVFPPADFDSWARELASALGLGMGKVMKPLRAALSGTLGGPPVGEILGLLGRERALGRLRRAAGRLSPPSP
ncbi:MAG: glutamate--tRNA ligase [Planctomycetota bacterium]|nr:MAG: glutamate--tRNA ligase [Planctomycetota bacterium]